MGHATCISYLRDYVALPSVNPMGRSDISPQITGEARYAGHLREQLRGLGLDAELAGPADRPSVIAEVRAPGARETVMIASHLDTVPVDSMEIDPFDPRIEGGRLYGRGSCDTKAGMAALVAALERILPTRKLTRSAIVLGESDEEFGSIGARAIAQQLAGRPPQWVLATEPTSMRVVTHHKGIAIAELVARGRACHSSDPSAGKNAIVALSRAVLELEKLGAELAARPHPLLGHATLSVGQIGGGAAPNIVPELCWLRMDRRLLPGETPEQVRAQLEQTLARAGVKDDVSIARLSFEKDSLDTPHDHACVRACQDALASLGRSTEPDIAAFATDAGVLAAQGMPSVVLGPGSIAQAHTAREHVEIAEVEAMTEFFVALLTS
jgi:acetylornithine deacetylase/succinyl-diaminopimelate desuccinylase-like protein